MLSGHSESQMCQTSYFKTVCKTVTFIHIHLLSIFLIAHNSKQDSDCLLSKTLVYDGPLRKAHNPVCF